MRSQSCASTVQTNPDIALDAIGARLLKNIYSSCGDPETIKLEQDEHIFLFSQWLLDQKSHAPPILNAVEQQRLWALQEIAQALCFLITSQEFLQDYHITLFEYCLDLVDTPNLYNAQGTPLLSLALQMKQQPLVVLLLKHKPTLTLQDTQGISVLEYFFEHYSHEDVHFLDRILPPYVKDGSDRFGRPWLQCALSKEHPNALVSHLLSLGADPNAADPEGYTPLMSAARFGHVASVRELLSYGANPKIQIHDYLSALSISLGGRIGHWRYGQMRVQNAHVQCAAILLQDMGEQHLDESLVPPLVRLWLSTLRFEPTFMNLLCDAGANIQHTDAQGDTLLHWASIAHNPSALQLCQWALQKGANPSVVNEKGQLPYQSAWMRHNEPCALLLQSAHEKGTFEALLAPNPLHASAQRL